MKRTNIKTLTKSFSRTQLVIFIMAFALIGAFILISSKAAGPTANLWLDTNGGSCSRSATPIAYNDAQACGSIQAAYSACQNGDTVGVVAGTYSFTQQISTDNTQLTSACAFIGQGVVNFGTIDAYLISHIKLSSMTIDSFTSSPNTNYVERDLTLDHDTIRAFKVNAHIDGFSVTNSTMDGQGGYDQPQIAAFYPGCCATSPAGLTLNPSNITLSNNVFTNYKCDSTCLGNGIHTECIQIRSWDNELKIDHNLFYNCDATAYLSLGNDHGSGTADVSNNVFGCGGSASTAVTLPYEAGATVNFEYNSSACKGFGSQYPGTIASTWNVIGNYSPYNPTLCHGTVQYNLSSGGNCTGTGNQTVASLDFVDGTNNDFHLKAGANAINLGGTACSGTTDYYNTSRPQGSACDAGADEYVAAPTINVWLSTSGNDSTCVRGDQTKPCASFDKADAIANPGDIITVLPGTYTANTVNYGSGTNIIHSTQVTYQCQSGAASDSVNFTDPEFLFGPGAANITFKGSCFHFHIPLVGLRGYDSSTNPANLVQNVTFDGVHMDSFDITGAKNVTVKNSQIGPINACFGIGKAAASGAPASAECSPGNPTEAYWATQPNGTLNTQDEPFVHDNGADVPTNVTFDHNHFTGMQTKWPTVFHQGGLLVWGTNGLTMTGNIFDHNTIYNIEFNAGTNEANGVFQNNVLGSAYTTLADSNPPWLGLPDVP